MIAVIALTAVALYIDARREGSEALADFARDQATLADVVASSSTTPKIGELILERDDDGHLTKPDGIAIDSPPIAEAIARGDRTVTLTRPQAAALGLPERTAVAGIGRRANGHAVAVVASALHVRDRVIRAERRLLLGMVLVSLVVFGFGGIALRLERKERFLERDEQLVRADKLATMGAFATGIAHEIATPLGVIATRTEMLAPREGDERTARAAKSITEQVEKIRGIIESFLLLARGEHAAHVLVDARELVASASEMVQHRFGAAGIALDVKDDGHAARVSGEKRLLEQALVNLLLNACDASERGQHVRLDVQSDGEHVRFVVADDGAGIAADVAARATEPFFTTKPAGRGTGLGLAIVNEIAKHHQGRFTIAARDGGGTDACLELPERSVAKEKAA